eukprot:3928850-Rhodomonas_salina.1
MSRTTHVTMPGRKAHGRSHTSRMLHATTPDRKAHCRSQSKCLECSTRPRPAERPMAGREANVLMMLATMPG